MLSKYIEKTILLCNVHWVPLTMRKKYFEKEIHVIDTNVHLQRAPTYLQVAILLSKALNLFTSCKREPM